MKRHQPSNPTNVRRLLREGKPVEALAAGERLVQAKPHDADGHALLAEVLLACNRPDDALTALDSGLALDRDHVAMRRLRGALHLGKGDEDAALGDFERVASIEPGNGDADINAGAIHQARGNHEAALVHFDRAIGIDPLNADFHFKRGLALKELGRGEEAISSLNAACDIQPGNTRYVCTLAEALRDGDRSADALQTLEQALHATPDDAILLNHRGATFFAMGRYEEALASFDRAIERQPGFIDALGNRGVVLTAFGRESEAESTLRLALELDPGRVVTHWNLALCLLRLGKFAEGWREHEWRWKKKEFRRFDFGFAQPRWDGSQSLEGKTLLITAEQGLGDSMQFVRYVRALRSRAARILLFVQSGLVELFTRSFPDVTVTNALGTLPDFDFHCPMLSLPLALHTDETTIPSDMPYLAAPMHRIVRWQPNLAANCRKRIGLVWAGSPKHLNDINRSIPLQRFSRVLAATDCHFFVLQVPLAEADRRFLADRPNVTFFTDDIKDFSDTAAIVSSLDLVITVDTSVAHLAGAMGKPVWVLLPRLADWRWLMHRSDSPWYPTARLYRQTGTEDWPQVLSQLASDLEAFLPDAGPRAENTITSPNDALLAAAEFHRRGQLDDAIALYTGVLQLDLNDFDANHMLGVARSAQGAHDEAESLIRRARAIRPDNLQALKNLAHITLRAGKHEKAILATDEVLRRKPDDANAWGDRAISLIALARHDEALDALDKALAINPDMPHALNNRGIVLLHFGRHAEALVSIDRALELKPGFVDAISNRGLVLLALDRAPDAVENYKHGLASDPAEPGLLCNMGVALMALARLDEAADYLRKAIELRPDNVDAHWNLALALLALGQYVEGWREYEWRWQRADMQPHKREYHVPRWSGTEPLAGRTLLLHHEQGFGDTFQFLRYLRVLENQGARIIMAIPDAIKPLAMESFPNAGFFSGEEVLPPFDYHLPMMSLPNVLGTTLETIPSGSPPYLSVGADLLRTWKARLPTKSGTRVGLAWSGNLAHRYDSSRSIPLDEFETLFALPDVEFFGLQKDIRAHDAETACTFQNLHIIGPDFKDFSDTAAAISSLDLVISVDTSIAHLAGALGKPVWIILPFAADWRWLTRREDSPWYPSARLFRQEFGRPQRETLDRIRHALAQFKTAGRA